VAEPARTELAAYHHGRYRQLIGDRILPTFIDESGTSSPDNFRYFHLAAIWIPTQHDAQSFRDDIALLRRRHRFAATLEFKYENAHNHPNSTTDFFECAMRVPFRFAVCSIDKKSPDLRGQDRRVLFWATSVHLAACLWSCYRQQEATHQPRPLLEPIKVDDNKDKEFLRIVTESFRGLRSPLRPTSSMTGKISFGRSSSDELLQLADMVCGCVAEVVRRGRSDWLDLIRPRSIDMALLE